MATINTTTKFWLGLLVTAVTSAAGTIGWAYARISTVEAKIDRRVEDHRVKELHAHHPSKDAFEAVQRDLVEIRRVQERMAEKQDEQSKVLNRIAEKVGVR